MSQLQLAFLVMFSLYGSLKLDFHVLTNAYFYSLFEVFRCAQKCFYLRNIIYLVHAVHAVFRLLDQFYLALSDHLQLCVEIALRGP